MTECAQQEKSGRWRRSNHDNRLLSKTCFHTYGQVDMRRTRTMFPLKIYCDFLGSLMIAPGSRRLAIERLATKNWRSVRAGNCLSLGRRTRRRQRQRSSEFSSKHLRIPRQELSDLCCNGNKRQFQGGTVESELSYVDLKNDELHPLSGRCRQALTAAGNLGGMGYIQRSHEKLNR